MNNCNYVKAINYIEDLGYNDNKSLLIKAEALRKLGKVNQSLIILQKIISSDSTNIQVFDEIGNCYFLTGNDLLALKTYQSALKLNPNNLSLLTRLTETQFRMKRYANAIETAKTILKRDSTQSVDKIIAKCYNYLDDIDNSIKTYNNIISKDSIDIISVIDLADIYIKQDSIKNAIRLTDAFMKNNSLNINLGQSNALSYFLNSDYKNALKKYQRLFQLGDSSTMNYYYLGVCYYKEKKPSKAYDYLTIAKEKTKSKKFTVLYFYALAAYDICFFDEGIAAMKEAINLMQPDSSTMSNLYTSLSDGYISKGESNNAIEALKTALTYKKNITQLFYNIAYVYDLKGDYRSALTYYSNFLNDTEGIEQSKNVQIQRKNAKDRITIIDEKSLLKLPHQ